MPYPSFLIFAASKMNTSVAFYTLGCKLNFTETSAIGSQLSNAGMQTVDFTEGADIYVINTCSVTDHADRKCKRVVREALKHNENAFVVIVGCYAQLKPAEIAQIPGVDLVLGAAEKFNLMHHLADIQKRPKATVHNGNIKETRDFFPAFSKDERTRTFLKVQDGCDYFCSFCTIPLARGKSRSASIEQTLISAQEAAKHAKEIVLTGVNIGDFGVGNNESFYALIQAIEKQVDIERIRISSIEPNLLSNDIISWVSNSQKFVPHFHIPLQSGSDELLGSMRRKYRTELYINRIKTIKNLMPDCCIGVDVIVGYPGETDAHFKETYQFLNDLDISYLHVFPYSERPNTTAYKLKGVVPHKTRTERVQMLRILSEKKRAHFYRTQQGKVKAVLFEAEKKDGFIYGFTDNYIKVKAAYDPLLVDEIVWVALDKLDSAGFYDVERDAIQEKPSQLKAEANEV